MHSETDGKALTQALAWISQASDLELNDAILAVVRRYGQIHAESELLLFSVPRKDPVARSRELTRILAVLSKDIAEVK